MVIAEIHSNLDHSGVVILWMVNGCNGLNLMAYSWSGQSLRRLIGWAGLVLTCLSMRVLGLNGSRKVKRRWFCFDVVKDLLDDVWISDVGLR